MAAGGQVSCEAGEDEGVAGVARSARRGTRAGSPAAFSSRFRFPTAEPDTVCLYEVYADDAVFDIHNASPTSPPDKQASEPLLVERDISWCTILE